MKFEHQSTVPAPRATVWSFLMDVPRVARCVPGVEAIEALGDDRYRGLLRISVGPIRLALAGEVAVTLKDEAAGIAGMRATAADKGAGGAVSADLRIEVRDGATPGTSELRITTDAQVMGRIGEFGQPIIKRKADQTMGEFAGNLARAVAGTGAA